MESIEHLIHGFSLVPSPFNLWMATVGCFLGTIVGIFPGWGPSATIAMLLPLTFGMDTPPAMIRHNHDDIDLLRGKLRRLDDLDSHQCSRSAPDG